ncbi:hydroxymethylbilane synthase [Leptospira sarikeiensis]|uniref:Hydroxymethylbilane synthase n=1 Tax=Leptospira sarikeiensis TaxID=2484943 RepID=A0A4V3JR74_9LEPT|nr:hydroxymethylbilane synthase [Leptospira sarikeiensis]TGL58915.1 hydroxymethylbilane synthase [Leptospira sarikeiensis]
MSDVLRIGSRKSSLAKLQTCLVQDSLRKFYPELDLQLFFKEASGDQDLTTPLWKMGSKGVFTQDLTKELVEGNVDLVVHSYKDLDLEGHDGTEILMVLPRADQRDVLLFKRSSFDHPPKEIKIHSSSPRREYNLSAFLPNALPFRLQNLQISFHPVRGNVQTRIRKWKSDPEISGFVVAKAALDRLLSENFSFSSDLEYVELRKEIRSAISGELFMVLPLSKNPNAPAQGALAAEIRKGDERTKKLLSPLFNLKEEEAVSEERKILSYFGGGCHQKIGVSVILGGPADFLFVRGKTDSGVELDAFDRWKGEALPKPSSLDSVFPKPRQGFRMKRSPLPTSVPKEKFWFVSRADSLPGDWELPGPETIYIVAGAKTWEKLAAKDVWVNGSTDGLGEEDAKTIVSFFEQNPEFIKLTHEESDIIEGVWKRFVTYKVDFDSEQPDLSEYSHFFWMSASQFDRAYKKNPEIAEKIHSCGTGATYKYIRKTLGSDAKIFAFPNFESWERACKGEVPDFLTKRGAI